MVLNKRFGFHSKCHGKPFKGFQGRERHLTYFLKLSLVAFLKIEGPRLGP